LDFLTVAPSAHQPEKPIGLSTMNQHPAPEFIGLVKAGIAVFIIL
jgi:hypothetical protein